MSYVWNNTVTFTRKSYTCGHCGNRVGPDKGYTCSLTTVPGEKQVGGRAASIYICPHCTKPTFFDIDGKQLPGVRIGNDVAGITNEGVGTLYNEAGDCTALGAHTAPVLICRKILMNLAVHKGASEGKSFLDYVEYLAGKGYVPPDGKQWVDVIRSKGNEANHEIRVMRKDDALQILTFVEMLLRFVYEFPSMMTKPAKQEKPSTIQKPDSGDGIV